jgi:hypothetical protein
MSIELVPKILQESDSVGYNGDNFHTILGLLNSRDDVVRDAGI